MRTTIDQDFVVEMPELKYALMVHDFNKGKSISQLKLPLLSSVTVPVVRNQQQNSMMIAIRPF